ncbi:MAG TPA: aminopeptidase P family protein [Mesorhizobium sp.]|jgi:Xaa-Pro aminopeptidase|uniref:aminopeptidase P family protein n=1 Tax=Mesorhizobium sp. TaxID=1871066 RepID=UPI002DDCBED7|nr:aminopeptidase P family protein [Mesorhizobium sp.]HEV2507548.1 aminopeptidase P family protein [Mesorhizobium sp.]
MTIKKMTGLARLRAWMTNAGLDGLIVPRADAHQSEVTAAHDDCLAYISGFTGSAGLALVLNDRALIFVDGRYQIQARHEVDPADFEIHHLRDEPVDQWLRAQARPGWRIGIDAMKVTLTLHDRLEAALAAQSALLVPLERDPFEAVWDDRPLPPLGNIRAMAVEATGERSTEKRRRIAEQLREMGADWLIETQPDNIAWLLNVRGSDVEMNPVPHSFLALGADGTTEWFVDARKLGNDHAAFEITGVALTRPEDFLDRIARLSAGKVIAFDADFTPHAVRARAGTGDGKILARMSPITLAKADKTATELEGYRACHIEDAVAATDFLAWVMTHAAERLGTTNPLTELEAETKLLAFRSERPGFLEPSFRTISAAGANAAMCHYKAEPATNGVIDDKAPYLVDSGGQYCTGTTDLTRTVMLGSASAEMRIAYTAVLRGFLSLLSARFPTGTQGHQLDAFARRALWDAGLDYDHGTGHGVGHNMLVHEYPHRFDKKPNLHGLTPGNIMTIEPGYYKEGAFGMRIENQVEVIADGAGFCRFSSLTLVPIDLAMANLDELSIVEIRQIDAYHAHVRSVLEPLVRAQTVPFLIEQTRPIVERRSQYPNVMRPERGASIIASR